MHDAFVSYSAQDKPTADAVCAKLESRGIRCWIAPRDVLPGEEYAEALVRAVHDSKLLVLVFSSRANQSPQVLRELERAVSKGMPIIPLRIEDASPSAAMEYYISSRHWLDALTPPLEHHLDQLADTVKLLLSRISVVPETASGKEASSVVQPFPRVSAEPDRVRPKSTFRDWVWPKTTSIEGAETATKQGFWAALFVGSVTALLAIIALTGTRVMGFDASALLDAAIFFAIAWRIKRFSRIAPIVGLALYVVGRLRIWAIAGFSNPILPIIVTLAFINSIRGTFAHRRLADQLKQVPGPARDVDKQRAA
jgi:hypothetical protein